MCVCGYTSSIGAAYSPGYGTGVVQSVIYLVMIYNVSQWQGVNSEYVML